MQKAIDIALKDLLSSLRSTIGVAFMFVIPLMVTALFNFMFGGIGEGEEFELPRTQVVVVNLDAGSPLLQLPEESAASASAPRTLGDLVLYALGAEEISDLVQISQAPDAAAARQAVDRQEAQAAIIIPADFSAQYVALDGRARLEFYQDPTLAIGPAIVRSILERAVEGMAEIKIAIQVALQGANSASPELAGLVVGAIMQRAKAAGDEAKLLQVRSPSAAPAQGDPLGNTVGLFMGGMLIFYAFYTGVAIAQSILREEERRTLPRLFTTPTRQATILTGKFLAVFLTVFVQILVLGTLAALIFKVHWGSLFSIALTVIGVVLIASTFGIFLNSWMKDTKQGGILFGGVLTFTGMLGMISLFTLNAPSRAPFLDTVALFVPQGWAVRALMNSMGGQPTATLLLTALVLLAWSTAFFAIGIWRFNRRYA